MRKDIHSVRYRDLFSSHPLGNPLPISAKSSERVIILSDCHLDERFDQKRYLQLKRLIVQADYLIINGDFWADSHVSFEKFVNSKWNKLFPSLLKAKAYYIFGNHDMPIHSDSRIYMFCTWAGFRIKLRAGDLSFHIEHGHLLSENIVKKTLMVFEDYPRLLQIATFPLGALENIVRFGAKKSKVTWLNTINKPFKIKRFEVSPKDEYFVMGHTHLPELDLKQKYINTGLTHKGSFNYVEIYKNSITLKNIE